MPRGFFLKEKWEDQDSRPIPASTVFVAGDALIYDGSGNVIPATPGLPVEGIGLINVSTTDPDYAATTKSMFFNRSGAKNQYHYNVPVNGTATAAMVGKVFNVYTNAGTLDVTAYNTLTYNTLAVSTFAVGHVITGGTSSATGTITQVFTSASGVQTLVFTTLAGGPFVEGETITDGTSSATAKVATVFAGGTQFEVTAFISAAMVEVTVFNAA